MNRILALALLLACIAQTCHGFRRVVYLPNWSQFRRGVVGGTQCKFEPSEMPPNDATHLVWAFAFLSPQPRFEVQTTQWNDLQQMAAMNALKQKNPALRTLLGIGGYSFNDPGPTHWRFSNMVSTAASRRSAINSILSFTRQHNFNGVEIDWEFPGIRSRGGRPGDRANLVALIRELRNAANAQGRGGFVISIAIPACPVNCEGFNLPALSPLVNFFNVMAYDYNGGWSPRAGLNAPWVDPQGGHDIEKTLDHLIRVQRLGPGRLNLGLPWFGRGWLLRSNIANQGPGALAQTRAGPTGGCLRQAGYLAFFEAQNLVARGARVTIDNRAMQAWLQLGVNWVSFDIPQTIFQKIQRARERRLGGVMAWEGSLDDGQHTMASLMRTQTNPGPFQPYRGYRLQVTLSGGQPASISAAQRTRLAQWNVNFAGVGANGQAISTAPSGIILTWNGNRHGQNMLNRANSRFATTPCPNPAILARQREVQAILTGFRVTGFLLVGTSPSPDNVQKAYNVGSVRCPGAMPDKAAASDAELAALIKVMVAEAANETYAGVAMAPPGATDEEWLSILLAGMGTNTSALY